MCNLLMLEEILSIFIRKNPFFVKNFCLRRYFYYILRFFYPFFGFRIVFFLQIRGLKISKSLRRALMFFWIGSFPRPPLSSNPGYASKQATFSFLCTLIAHS